MLLKAFNHKDKLDQKMNNKIMLHSQVQIIPEKKFSNLLQMSSVESNQNLNEDYQTYFQRKHGIFVL